ncbi:FAD/NAD(P)-binding protein [Hansschlegelia sp. KR7-227]|uniref:FAD/NAD(P)-binding protein n=1 Tax=Hansschlegelia sp. KR7-227 TaxID=3400914 RepID=UPI003C051136
MTLDLPSGSPGPDLRGDAPTTGEIPMRSDPRSTLVVIGGGFTGAMVAHQVARRAPGAIRVVVVEPRPRLGAGVAYSTLDPAHRLNVPAKRMTFIQSDPNHFDRWLKANDALADDPAAELPDGRSFPRRAVFGRYCAETIEPFLAAGAIEHARTRAISARRNGGGYLVTLADGRTIDADYVALAATHPAAGAPSAFSQVLHDRRLIRDTQARDALDEVAPDARVLIVGSGLTMADIVASLDARGHRGPIIAVSRRGLLSRGHPAQPGEEYGSLSEPPSRSALDLSRRIRRTIADAAAEGLSWHYVLDAARTQGPAIWANLPEAERARLVRRLRPFWDVHRFRVAPQIEAVIARKLADGSLLRRVGEPVEASSTLDAVKVAFRLRGGGHERRDFDAVALATGPAHRGLVDSDPLVSGLAASGLIALDRVGLGLDADLGSLAVGPDGRSSPAFWIAGPLARGAFGEIMGLPEVARHAEFVATEVVKADHAARKGVRAVA